MNKKLFVKVKDLCKDTGLSEKYLTTITEKMGGSIEDDSTDEAAIEGMANQIADIAKEAQGEATRWANGKKDDKGSKGSESKEKKEEGAEGKTSKEDAENERLKTLEDELAILKGDKAKEERAASVKAAQTKHGIPEWRMKGLVVPEGQDPDGYLANIKQDLITQNLMPADTEGSKAASDKATDELATSLLDSITVK